MSRDRCHLRTVGATAVSEIIVYTVTYSFYRTTAIPASLHSER